MDRAQPGTGLQGLFTRVRREKEPETRTNRRNYLIMVREQEALEALRGQARAAAQAHADFWKVMAAKASRRRRKRHHAVRSFPSARPRNFIELYCIEIREKLGPAYVFEEDAIANRRSTSRFLSRRSHYRFWVQR
jgi:hypothetical protein